MIRIKNKRFTILSFFLYFCLSFNAWGQENAPGQNSFKTFLKDIDFTTRIKLEQDDNIFLTENDENSDFKQILTQGMKYSKSFGKQYVSWDYVGNYSYFDNESEGILSHSGKALYSYRPYEKFSVGLKNDITWLQNSDITTAIGDRLLALGYTQVMPGIQLKYEMSPATTFVSDLGYQNLNVSDNASDTFIDNEEFKTRTAVNQVLFDDKSLVGLAGFEWERVNFAHTSQKESETDRPFIGLLKKFPGLFNVSTEVGFADINMKNPSDEDDNNVDFKLSLESVFSIYTKLNASYTGMNQSYSLRSDYAKYSSNLLNLGLSHAISPKSLLSLNYSYEFQDFDSSDVLVGIAAVDHEANIHNVNLAFTQQLNSWLTVELSYGHVTRDTDFASESYEDNKFGIGLTARY